MSYDNRPPGPNQGMPEDLSAGQPAGGDPTGSAPRVPNDWPRSTSRRRFLKAALISSAAGLAAGGATYAAIESVASVPSSTYKFIGQSGSPGAQTASACTTGTGVDNDGDSDDHGTDNDNDLAYIAQTTFGKTEGIFLWAQFDNLPAASYSFTATVNGNPIGGGCTGGQPFSYVGTGSAAVLYNLGKTNPAWTCSPPTSGNLPTSVKQASSVPGLGSYSVTTAGDDLELRIHIKNACSSGGTYTVKVNLFQGTNTTPFLFATSTIIIS